MDSCMAFGDKGKGSVKALAGHLANVLGWHEDVLSEDSDFQIAVQASCLCLLER